MKTMKNNWDNTESKGGSDTNGDDEHNIETCEKTAEDCVEQREEVGQGLKEPIRRDRGCK
jgi:hypothetical protein